MRDPAIYESIRSRIKEETRARVKNQIIMLQSPTKKEKPNYQIEQLSAEYTQEADAAASLHNSDINQIKIFTQDAGGKPYLIIQTERWAFDNVEEFIDLLRDFESRLQMPTF